MKIIASIDVQGLVYPLLQAGHIYTVRQFITKPRGQLKGYKLHEVYGIFNVKCFTNKK